MQDDVASQAGASQRVSSTRYAKLVVAAPKSADHVKFTAAVHAFAMQGVVQMQQQQGTCAAVSSSKLAVDTERTCVSAVLCALHQTTGAPQRASRAEA